MKKGTINIRRLGLTMSYAVNLVHCLSYETPYDPSIGFVKWTPFHRENSHWWPYSCLFGEYGQCALSVLLLRQRQNCSKCTCGVSRLCEFGCAGQVLKVSQKPCHIRCRYDAVLAVSSSALVNDGILSPLVYSLLPAKQAKTRLSVCGREGSLGSTRIRPGTSPGTSCRPGFSQPFT